eukprot:IDg3687t1
MQTATPLLRERFWQYLTTMLRNWYAIALLHPPVRHAGKRHAMRRPVEARVGAQRALR